MTPDECPHGMEDPAWCSLCKRDSEGLRLAEHYASVVLSRPFPARFDGSCEADCGHPIYASQRIVRLGEGYAHEGCAP